MFPDGCESLIVSCLSLASAMPIPLTIGWHNACYGVSQSTDFDELSLLRDHHEIKYADSRLGW